jgi:hypothetical protein
MRARPSYGRTHINALRAIMTAEAARGGLGLTETLLRRAL